MPITLFSQQRKLHVKRDPRIVAAPGKFVLVSGTSAAGKGELTKRVRQHPDVMKRLGLVKTITTRLPRHSGEHDTNHFLSVAAFMQAVKENRLFEWSPFATQFYGRYLHEVLEVVNRGLNFLLEFSPPDALTFQETYPEKTKAVLVMPPEPVLETIEQRLIQRNTETPEEIQLRLAEAKRDLTLRHRFSDTLVNENGKEGQAAEWLTRFILDNTIPPPDSNP